MQENNWSSISAQVHCDGTHFPVPLFPGYSSKMIFTETLSIGLTSVFSFGSHAYFTASYIRLTAAQQFAIRKSGRTWKAVMELGSGTAK